MRLLFVADGRSQISLNWIHYFLDEGDEVHLVSSFPCEADVRFASFNFIPVAFSEYKSDQQRGKSTSKALSGHVGTGFKTRLRQWLGPFTLVPAARRLAAIIDAIQPDLVHAMRIPYEGMFSAIAIAYTRKKRDYSEPNNNPLLVSIWGNDFTLHAPTTPWMRYYTRQTLRRASAIHADCQRDVRLAYRWGLDPGKPAIVLPGAGGVQSELFHLPLQPVDQPIVINPRGFRAYVNNSAFFHAIPTVLDQIPNAQFLCPSMAGVGEAEHWVKELGISAQVELLPIQTRQQMAELFRRSQVAVSPSNHDGTPNTLLEAMACGCLPVAGDLESLREWITTDVNGLLVDPNDPAAIATAILRSLNDDQLQRNARSINTDLIATRAEYRAVMHQAKIFYNQLLEKIE